MSPTLSFLELKNLPLKKVPSHGNRWKNALFKVNFWSKQKNTCLVILNDKPNCQVSRIFMNRRLIHVKELRE
jgi:hypothetical protein